MLKVLSVLALLSLVPLGARLYWHHDLRGWPPADRGNPTTVVQATRPGGGTFTVSDCVPGTVHPWDSPLPDEYSGTATVTVLTCRSRSSAIRAMLIYGAVAIFALALAHRIDRWRTRRLG
jgi:hypothetical protein